MKKMILGLSCLLCCGALHAMEGMSSDELELQRQTYRLLNSDRSPSSADDFDVAFRLAEREIAGELQQTLDHEARAAVRSNSNQVSQDEAYARELQRQLDGQGNVPVAEQGHRAPIIGRSNSNQLSQDEAYARELQRQLDGQGNAPVAEQGHSAPVGRSNSNQMSQDEAYARELQRQLNGQGNAPVAEQGHRAPIIGRFNSNQLSQDEAYARELQRQWDDGSFDSSQLEAYAREVQRDGEGSVEAHGAPVSNESTIWTGRQIDRPGMHPMKIDPFEKLYPEGRGRWVKLVEEVLPGNIPHASATRMSQVIAQEVLRNGPPIRQFILSQVSLPFKDFVGHTIGAVFNSAGNKMVTASRLGPAEIWDIETGRLLHTLVGHTGEVWSAAFNPTVDKVVTGSGGTAKIWDTETGTLLHTLQGHTSYVYSAMFNPTGAKVVTASHDGTAKIWDTEMGTLLHTLVGHTNTVWSAMFNPTGAKVVTPSQDGTAKIWDTETGTLLHTLEGHTDDVWSAMFNPTGAKVVTASYDGTAKIWDTETGTLLHTLIGHTYAVSLAMFNQNGAKVVTASYDGTAKIWETETGTLLHTLEAGYVRLCNSTGDKVVTASRVRSRVRSAEIWDTETGRLLHTLEGHRGAVSSAVFHPTGDRIVANSEDGTARIWDLGPLVTCQKFLAEDITLQQVAILNDIFEVKRARDLQEDVRVVQDITFDFNKYPHLWDDYASLPEAIRMIFDPYITKPSSN